MVLVGDRMLTVKDFSAILYKEKPIALNESALSEMETNFRFLENFSSNKLIYGINTGFGPMAQYKISDENLLQLQYNLIRSHCSGSGELMSPLSVKALMLARLNSLVQAYSGVHTDVAVLLKDLINLDITPCIYKHGGVGASGDLVQLAHLALVLIGEGSVQFKNNIHPTAEIFERFNLKPLAIRHREGLAILNGTSAMTGIGMINLVLAKKLLQWSILFSSMINEVVEAFDDHFSYELNIVKHHNGQIQVASQMREILADSKMIRSRAEHLYNPQNLDRNVFEDKVQEYYSLRCVTQVLGPVYDTLTHAEKILLEELNSVNDNPVIDHRKGNVYHGGNFHGDYVSLEMDKIKIAMTRVSMLAERQLNYLLNDKLNKKLPPFINMGVLGLNFGLQGMQFTATSTVAENQTLSFPMYVHSIPNNNDNQDIVSMGCNGAVMTNKVIENCFEVLTIQAMAILQAIDCLGCHERLSSASANLYSEMRKLVPVIHEDKPMYGEQKKLKDFLEANDVQLIIKPALKIENQVL